MDETKTNPEEAAPAFVDLLIIGGPKTDAPPRCSRSFLQVPFTLTGLADARPLVPEANIIVYWPDRSIFEIPTAEACMRFDEFDIVARMYPEDLWEVALSKWLVDIQNQPKALDTLHDLIGRALRNVMAPAFEAVRAGFAVIVVVPADFPDWEHPANGVFQWFSKHLHVYKVRGRRTAKNAGDSGGAFLARVVEAHTSWIRDWPLVFSMSPDELIHPDCTDVDFKTTDTDIFSICHDTPDDAMDVYVSAATLTRKGEPTSMVVEYGKGGFLIVPPPDNPQRFFDVCGDAFSQPVDDSPRGGGNPPADSDPPRRSVETKGHLLSKLHDKEKLAKWHETLGLTRNDKRRGPINSLEILAQTLDALSGGKRDDDLKVEVCNPNADVDSKTETITGRAIRKLIKRWSKKADQDNDLMQFLGDAMRACNRGFAQK